MTKEICWRWTASLSHSIIGVLPDGMLASFCFTVSAFLSIQAEEIQRFNVTTARALTSFCGWSFKGHGGLFKSSIPSNQNTASCFLQELSSLRGYACHPFRLSGARCCARCCLDPLYQRLGGGMFVSVQMPERCSARLPVYCTGGSPLSGSSACDHSAYNKSVPWFLSLMSHADRSAHIRHRCLSLDTPTSWTWSGLIKNFLQVGSLVLE